MSEATICWTQIICHFYDIIWLKLVHIVMYLQVNPTKIILFDFLIFVLNFPSAPDYISCYK